MKLLFDQNLSPRLVSRLSDIYSDSSHVSMVALDRATDDVVWSYALENDYVIVTKDSDFSDVGVLRGFPPKVIWIRLGNCPTGRIELSLRTSYDEIVAFASDAEGALLEIV